MTLGREGPRREGGAGYKARRGMDSDGFLQIRAKLRAGEIERKGGGVSEGGKKLGGTWGWLIRER